MTLDDFPIFERRYLTRAHPIIDFKVAQNGIVAVVVPGNEEGKGAIVEVGIKAFPDPEAIEKGDYLTRDLETDRWKHVKKKDFEEVFSPA